MHVVFAIVASNCFQPECRHYVLATANAARARTAKRARILLDHPAGPARTAQSSEKAQLTSQLTHSAGQSSTRENFTMKIRSTECLLFVATATAATVAQIRAHTLSASQADVPAQTAPHTAHMQACDPSRSGTLRAACETRSERRSIDSNDRRAHGVDTPNTAPGTGKLWV
ncbi:hypothetical protein [Paraburkholderia caribensis]|uniref:hypothetical protein n=1 Tax=Paraburkholderia caribensis TaxID=75105 RepID=UPI001CC5221A|nr:hypothetical protein [Paraburkholderia caribensis]